jgi:hypothetical protein
MDWVGKSLSTQAVAAAQFASPLIVHTYAKRATERGVCERCDGLKWVFVDPEIDPSFVPGGVKTMTVYVKQMVEVKGKQKEKLVAVERHTRTCPVCSGSGLKPKSEDIEAARLVTDISGHTGKQAKIQINQNFGGAGLDARREQLNRIPFDVDVESEEVPDPPGPAPAA